MTTDVLIKVDNLCKSFDDVDVLKGVNAEIEKGDEAIKAYLRRAKEMPSECIDGSVLDSIRERYAGVDGEITSLVSQIIFK